MLTINRTKVELKCIFIKLSNLLNRFYQSYQSGIEMIVARFMTASIILSIVPKWNWNGFSPVMVFLLVALSIVPKWNWNLVINLCRYLCSHYQSYQSGIEILYVACRGSSTKTINRTKVELKSISASLFLYLPKSYQSYQSGIEIRELQ